MDSNEIPPIVFTNVELLEYLNLHKIECGKELINYLGSTDGERLSKILCCSNRNNIMRIVYDELEYEEDIVLISNGILELDNLENIITDLDTITGIIYNGLKWCMSNSITKLGGKINELRMIFSSDSSKSLSNEYYSDSELILFVDVVNRIIETSKKQIIPYDSVKDIFGFSYTDKRRPFIDFIFSPIGFYLKERILDKKWVIKISSFRNKLDFGNNIYYLEHLLDGTIEISEFLDIIDEIRKK